VRIELPKVFVFDIDDTLYLERDYVQSGFQAVGAWFQQEFEIEKFADRCWSLFDSGVRGNIFDQAIESVGQGGVHGLVEQLVAVYRAHRPSISLLPDARATLDYLHQHAQLALISDGPLRVQENKIRTLGLDAYVDLILLTDRWGREDWKPSERSYREVEKRLRLQGKDCLYVADNPHKDFVAPRSLGWQSVRVRRPEGLHYSAEAQPETAADWELEDLTRLSEMFQTQVA